jgi:DNA-binding winged helix-turn-helix (wHTH) protein
MEMADSAPNELALKGEREGRQKGRVKGVQSSPSLSPFPERQAGDASPVRSLTPRAEASDLQLLDSGATDCGWLSRDQPDLGVLDLGDLRPAWVWTCGLDLRVTAVLYAQNVDDPERFIGHNDYDWLAASEAESLMERKRRAIDAAVPMRHRVIVSWAGQAHKLDLILTPNFDAQGAVENLTCVCFDLTPDLSQSNSTEPWNDGASSVATDSAAAAVVTIGAIELCPPLHALRGPLREVRLTKTEWNLLECLVRERGQLVCHHDLLRSVWGPGYKDEVSLLHDAVSRLRQRLRAAGADCEFIRTVHGVGYCLDGHA